MYNILPSLIENPYWDLTFIKVVYEKYGAQEVCKNVYLIVYYSIHM